MPKIITDWTCYNVRFATELEKASKLYLANKEWNKNKRKRNDIILEDDSKRRKLPENDFVYTSKNESQQPASNIKSFAETTLPKEKYKVIAEMWENLNNGKPLAENTVAREIMQKSSSIAVFNSSVLWYQY